MACSAFDSLNLVEVSKPVEVIFSRSAVSGKLVLAGKALFKRLARVPLLLKCLYREIYREVSYRFFLTLAIEPWPKVLPKLPPAPIYPILPTMP